MPRRPQRPGLLLPVILLAAGCAAARPAALAPGRTPFPADRLLRAGTPAEAGLDAARLEQVGGVIEAAIADSTIPGAVVLVARGGIVVLHRAWGMRSLVPVSEPMTRDTIFDLASCTKPLATAPSVMKLVEAGRVRLQDPVARYLPGFEAEGKGAITVAQLLTHTSGLAAYAPVDSIAARWGRPTVEGVWEWITTHPPVDEPGSRFRYSDLNYVTLARLVERVSGRPLDRFAAEELYGPLGMTDTGLFPGPERRARTAPTEVLAEGVLRGVVHDPLARLQGGVGGSAGLFSTASDLAVYLQMLLNGGVYGGVRIFSPLTVRAMTTPREQGRGYGFDIASAYASIRGDLLGPASFGHSGYTGTSIWIDPDEDLFIILLTNRVHPKDVGSVVALRAMVSNVVAASIIGPPPAPR
jgi:CubicO group peptidase (beta-lactamase class C family)